MYASWPTPSVYNVTKSVFHVAAFTKVPRNKVTLLLAVMLSLWKKRRRRSNASLTPADYVTVKTMRHFSGSGLQNPVSRKADNRFGGGLSKSSSLDCRDGDRRQSHSRASSKRMLKIKSIKCGHTYSDTYLNLNAFKSFTSNSKLKCWATFRLSLAPPSHLCITMTFKLQQQLLPKLLFSLRVV